MWLKFLADCRPDWWQEVPVISGDTEGSQLEVRIAIDDAKRLCSCPYYGGEPCLSWSRHERIPRDELLRLEAEAIEREAVANRDYCRWRKLRVGWYDPEPEGQEDYFRIPHRGLSDEAKDEILRQINSLDPED